jgi:hypothetical protein
MGDYPRLLLTRWDQGAAQFPSSRCTSAADRKSHRGALRGRAAPSEPDLVARTEHMCSVSIYHGARRHGERKKPSPTSPRCGPNDVVQGNGWTVKAVGVRALRPAAHLVRLSALDSPEGSFVYSGDSGPATRWSGSRRTATCWFHMCHYISGTELCPEFAESCMGHKELRRWARRRA